MLEEIADGIAEAMEESTEFDDFRIGEVHNRPATLHTVANASFKITSSSGEVFVVRVTRAG